MKIPKRGSLRIKKPKREQIDTTTPIVLRGNHRQEFNHGQSTSYYPGETELQRMLRRQLEAMEDVGRRLSGMESVLHYPLGHNAPYSQSAASDICTCADGLIASDAPTIYTPCAQHAHEPNHG